MDERRKGSSSSSGDFGATTPNLKLPGREPKPAPPEAPRPAPPPPPPPPSPQPTPQPDSTKRRIPLWGWLAGGGVLLLAIAFVLFFVLLNNPGFILIVRGAEPGSDVFVDNVRRGVTAADGSIRVLGLKAGKRLVRVSHEGFNDFNTSISGKDGELKTVVAQLTRIGGEPLGEQANSSLPSPIDYNGQMILIPAGEFIMGDDNHLPDEKPTHKVTLPDYYIDKFEVTNEQYKKFCDATKRPYPTPPWWNSSYFNKSPKSPALGVNFEEAKAYAEWAGKRLPTEQEWEKAASWGPNAQQKRIWPWGSESGGNRSNIDSTRTVDVGRYSNGVSAYGVMDMSGNVGEWVESFFQPYPNSQVTNSDFGTVNRVVRGGTYRSKIEDARTTRRLYHTPELNESEKTNRAFLIGFRCVVSADNAKLQERLRARNQ